MCKGVVVRGSVAYMPVELRADIVNPTLTNPMKDIGIEIVVVGKTSHCSTTDGVTGIVAPNTKRRDTEFNPRLRCTDSVRYVLDSHIDVVPTPFADVSKSTRMCFETGFIGQRHTRFRIWVEVIVHVNSINVIAGNDVFDNVANPLACFVQARLEIPLFAILPEPLGMHSHDMIRDELGCIHHTDGDTVRIEPSMDLHVTILRLRNDELQRVVKIIYSCKKTTIILPVTLNACEPM